MGIKVVEQGPVTIIDRLSKYYRVGTARAHRGCRFVPTIPCAPSDGWMPLTSPPPRTT